MDDNTGYAVFLYPKALETLGEAITPYLREGKAGLHIVCREVDAGGPLLKMVLDATTTSGEVVALELLVPSSMVLMIVSARSEEAFGFGPRMAVEAARPAPDGSSRAQVEVQTAAKRGASSPAKRKPVKSATKSTSGSKPAKTTKAPRKPAKK